MSQDYKILVIIVTYNGMRWIDRCLKSVQESSYPLDAIIIDNNSNDGTPIFIAHHFPQFLLIENKNNLGFGGANNVGLRYALDNSYDFVYLLNQDAYLMKDTVSNLIREVNKLSDFGLLSPIQTNDGVNLDRNFSINYKKAITTNDPNIVEINFVMAAHWFLPISTIKDVGLFSPSFFQYGEDGDYINRLHYHGLKCGIVKDSIAIHDRAYRNDSREKKADIKYKQCIVELSNPSNIVLKVVFTQPIDLLIYGLKESCIRICLCNIFKMISQYPSILRNRKKSTIKGAFI